MANNRFWIKLYIEILDDPKMGQLPNHLWRRAVELFLLAGKTGTTGQLPPVEDMAWVLRLSEDKLLEDLIGLAGVGVVHEAEPKTWFVTHFESRQKAISDVERKALSRKERDGPENRQKRDSISHGNVTTRDTNSHEDVTKCDISRSREEEESEESREESPTTPLFRILSSAFERESKILMHNAPKWVRAFEQIIAQGATEDDIVTAIRELREKEYTIVGPWSIVNAVISVVGRRKNGANRKAAGPAAQEIVLPEGWSYGPTG